MASSVTYAIEVDPRDVEAMLDRAARATAPSAWLKWLQNDVYPWIVEETVQRFAFQGDWRSKNWPSLTDATQDIRESQGYEPDFPVNIRSEDLFRYVTTSKTTRMDFDGAELVVPGGDADKLTQKKYLTAQMGDDNNPMIEGAITPPRPVVAWGEAADAETVLVKAGLNFVQIMKGGPVL